MRSAILSALAAAVLVPAASAQVRINEVLVSTAGTDTEFIELSGTAGTSLDGHAILVIEGDRSSSTGIGLVDRVIDLAGQTIPADGYWLAGSPTFVAAYPTATVDLAIPDNAFENGTETILLVQGFTGAAGDDLDTDDNGTIDVTPWASIVDEVALVDNGINDTPPDAAYSTVVVGPDGTNLPAGAYRSGNGTGSFVFLEFTVPAPSATPGVANGGTSSTAPAAAAVASLRTANPAASTSAVRFTLAEAGRAALVAYDLTGRRVQTLAEGVFGTTEQTARLAGLAPGAYVLRLETAAGSVSQVVAVVR